MGIVAVELKVMPESIDTDLEKIKQEIKNELKEAKNIKIEEKEIAFGLKSLTVLVAWPEDIDTDKIENIVSKIEGVSSCQIEDIRRAFG